MNLALLKSIFVYDLRGCLRFGAKLKKTTFFLRVSSHTVGSYVILGLLNIEYVTVALLEKGFRSWIVYYGFLFQTVQTREIPEDNFITSYHNLIVTFFPRLNCEFFSVFPS